MKSAHAVPMRAVLFALIGFILWTAGDTCMKLAVGLGAPVRHELIPLSSLGGVFSILLIAAGGGRLKALRPQKTGKLALLGFLAALCLACWTYAFPHLPLGNFYAVLFLGPSLIAIMAVLFLKEHMDRRKAVAIVCGFAGVLIAVNPMKLLAEPGSALAYALVFAGTVCVAIQMLLLRSVSRHNSRECMALVPRVFTFLCGITAAAVIGFQPVPLGAGLYALCSGAIGGVGWIFVAQAYKAAPANVIAPFQYVQMVAAALAGYLIWNDVPGPNLIAGSIVIALSGIYLVTHLRRMARRQAALAENP